MKCGLVTWQTGLWWFFWLLLLHLALSSWAFGPWWLLHYFFLIYQSILLPAVNLFWGRIFIFCCCLKVFWITSWSSLILSSSTTILLLRPSDEFFISPIKFFHFCHFCLPFSNHCSYILLCIICPFCWFWNIIDPLIFHSNIPLRELYSWLLLTVFLGCHFFSLDVVKLCSAFPLWPLQSGGRPFWFSFHFYSYIIRDLWETSGFCLIFFVQTLANRLIIN